VRGVGGAATSFEYVRRAPAKGDESDEEGEQRDEQRDEGGARDTWREYVVAVGVGAVAGLLLKVHHPPTHPHTHEVVSERSNAS
jgi:hypothetical protein